MHCYIISSISFFEIGGAGAGLTSARRQGKAHAVLGWKFRATTKNSCDTMVAKFFVSVLEIATATRSTPKPGRLSLSPRYLTVFEFAVMAH
jgi:hypothetical protein